MSAHPRVLTRALVLLFFLAAAVSPGVAPTASAVTSHKPLNDTRPVGTGPVRVDFPIEYFGLVADLPTRTGHLPGRGRAPYGQARFHVRGHWTPWQALEQDGAQQTGHFTGALVGVDRADAYQVRGLPAGARNWRAAAINTTDGPTVVVGRRQPGAAVAAPRCMSRADWGADESISGWSHGDVQSYYPVQALTVHHTAGSNDLTQDYAATVRAIYSFHVQSNGWSDIGYQYLVDGHGTVYEGRNAGHTSTSCLYDGGDGSDFAHQAGTDYVVTGANVESYNSGNIGIALMGCYEPASTACAGDTDPPAAAVDGLESELALLSVRHGLDPEGTVHYVNPVTNAAKDVSTISGHRDWKSTECPGATLYDQLPAIRSNVASRIAGTTPMDSAVVAFRRSTQTVQEDGGTASLVVTRSGNTAVAASVGYARTSGTASPDADFTLAKGRLDFAAGETSKAIPVNVTDDRARENAETVGVTLRSPGTGTVLGSGTSTTLRVAVSDQRPDGWVGTAASSGYVGNNVYNTSGDNQTKVLTGRRTTTRTFFARVYNDGNVKDAFVLRGSAARSGSTVRYYSGTTGITKAMRSAAGWKVTLAPGSYKLVKVRVTVLRSAAFGSRKPATVRASWTGDGTREDLVKGVVRVVR